MAHFSLETAINEVTHMNAPIQRGPLMRWQRKAMEAGVRSLSLDAGLNTSGLSAPRSALTPASGKTPLNDKSMMCSPSRLGISDCNRLRAHSPSRCSQSDSILSMHNAKTPSKNQQEGRSKTPSKSAPNTPHQITGDRFIPNRGSTDMDVAHFMLMENVNPEDVMQSPGTAEYQRKMANRLNKGKDSKILSFKQKAPPAQEGTSTCYCIFCLPGHEVCHMNNLKVLYTGGQTTSCQKQATSRHIPQHPDQVLDAPELIDDYYLNLVSWSCHNFLAAALGSVLYLWDAGTGSITEMFSLENSDEYISSVSWINDGNILAVGNSLGAIQLWDVAQQKRMRTMGGHAARIASLSWNSYILSSGSRSGAIHHHDVRVADHHVGSLNGHTQEVCGLTWSPDGRFLASGANDNLLCIWDSTLSQNNSPVHTFTDHQAAVKALAWCPWQASLLASGAGTGDRHIRMWSVSTGECINSIDTDSQVSALLWSQHHKELVSAHGYSQNQLTIWKYPSMVRLANLTGHTARILALAMSPDGTTVLSAGADETFRLWRCFSVDKQKKTATKPKLKQTTGLMGSHKGMIR